MVFDKLKLKFLETKLKLKESNRERAIARIKQDYKKKEELQRQKEILMKAEADLIAKFKKARKDGLTKAEKEYFQKRKKAILEKRQQLKERSTMLARELGGILKKVGKGIVRTSVSYGEFQAKQRRRR